MTVNARSGQRGEAYERLLRQERLILDVTEALAGALEDSGVTRAELARRLGRTPGLVSQVLGGGRNLTLRTIADIAAALSLQPSFELSCERKSEPQWTYEHLPMDASDVTGCEDGLSREFALGRLVASQVARCSGRCMERRDAGVMMPND